MISGETAISRRGAGSAADSRSLSRRKKIRLGEVVRLGEESETVIDCKNRDGRLCRIFPACRLKGVLDEAAAAFFAVLDSYTLDDLLGQASALKDLLQIQNS